MRAKRFSKPVVLNVQRQGKFIAPRTGIQILKSTLFNANAIEEDTEIGRSQLNTPVYTNLTFGNANKETDENYNRYIDLEGNEIPFTPVRIDHVLLTITNTKNIIKTAIQGLNGTIKQYISDGDYLITARGAISSESNRYPADEITDLVNICEIPSEVWVTSNFLSLFGIEYVVIEDFDFPEIAGFRNRQEFTITMSSDIPIDLEDIIQ